MPPCILKDELYQMYVVEKKTDKQIAEVVGCLKQTVYNLRKKYEIKKIPGWSRKVCNPTQRQLDVIYGTIMGDGHISMRNEQRNSESCLSILHSISQKDYVDWKYQELSAFTLSAPKAMERRDETVRYRFRTFAHPFFTSLRKEFYPNETKVITYDILKKLSSLSIAVWFMDDGTNINSGSTFRFSTCSFSDSEHDLMVGFFKEKFGIQMRVSHYGGYPILRVDKDYKEKFVDLIRDHVPSCMEYKLKGYLCQSM